MKVLSLWSGGKDSCFAYYKAKLLGHDVAALVNFTEETGVNSISHGLSSEIIRRQARALDVVLIQEAMPDKGYRDAFKKLIYAWKNKMQIEGIVFGDIYLQEHKDWIDQVCFECDIFPLMPLWGKDTTELARDIIRKGFRAIVVSARSDIFGQEWLGREIDNRFLEELIIRKNIDLCGERGEFHTFVYAGPIFKNPVEFSVGKNCFRDKSWLLDIR